MDEILKHLLGEQPFQVWIAGFVWSFIGILTVKVYFLKNIKNFSLKIWFNDNTIDVTKGLFLSAVILRLGDVAFEIAKNSFGYNLGQTKDFVSGMILISMAIQVWLHKNGQRITDIINSKKVKK